MRKRLFQWAMAAALICGVGMFTACTSNDDNPVKPDKPATDKVHLTQQYAVAVRANGDTIVQVIEDFIWEDGLLRKTLAENINSSGSSSLGEITYVYDNDGHCIEEHYISSASAGLNSDSYFTYEGGRMTSAIEITGGNPSNKATITGYTADGHIQSITTEGLETGTVREYQLTWENGDMTGYTMHTIQPKEETLAFIIEYDEYPNIVTGMPLTSAVFDPQMIASRSSVHNWLVLDAKRFYANGRLVKTTSESAYFTFYTYYTYSDGTTGKE